MEKEHALLTELLHDGLSVKTQTRAEGTKYKEGPEVSCADHEYSGSERLGLGRLDGYATNWKATSTGLR